MNQEFIAQALRHGPEGKEWLAKIPGLIKEFEKKWRIEVKPPFNLSYNYVAPAIRKDQTPLVIKIGFPKDKEFQTEIDALETFAGDGCTKLYEADRNKCVILIEKGLPGDPLSHLTNDEEATKILTEVMKRLWKPAPEKNKFITIAEWMRAIPDYIARNNSKETSLPMNLVEKANELFQELIQTSKNPMLLHGDLHHGNVLSSTREGWIAIDPKGIIAEREYETAAMIRNPYEKMRTESDLEKILKKRLVILSEELGFDIRRIHKWCFAQTMLSAVWNDSGIKGSSHSIRIALALNKLRF